MSLFRRLVRWILIAVGVAGIGSWIPIALASQQGDLESVPAWALRDRLRRDVSGGKDIVITSYVALWYKHSDDPSRNLYWGALYGHEAMFRPSRRDEIARRLPFLDLAQWDAVYSASQDQDPIAIKVFALSHALPSIESVHDDSPSGDPTAPGRSSAQPSPVSRLIIVTLAYQDMRQAAVDLANQIKTGQLPRGVFAHPSVEGLMAGSYVMGYWGHNTYYGGISNDDLEALACTRADGPRGVFVIGCQTARWFPQKFLGPGIEPLLFTLTNMAPEGYIALALYDAIGRGLSLIQTVDQVADAYREYQGLRNRPRLFVAGADGIASHMVAVSGE